MENGMEEREEWRMKWRKGKNGEWNGGKIRMEGPYSKIK